MLKILASIARFTSIEALRTRVLWLAGGLLLLGFVLAEFAASLALTDSAAYRSGFYAAWSRLALVFVVTLFVATSVVRELQDRLLDLTLSRPVSRASWYLGRLAGFGATALLLAVLATLPLAASSPPAAAMVWGLSLAAELWLMAAACLACVVTLGQVTAAVVVVAGFYLLSRAINAIVLMSKGPAVDPAAWTTLVIQQAVELLALVLPALDRFTQSVWLNSPGGGTGVLLDVGVQTAIYSALLISVGLFDFYRRNY